MTEAEALVAQGRAFDDDGDLLSAESCYRRAAALSPEWSVPHYNLGLLCKYQSRWAESLEFNQRAAALDPEDEAAWWNLGIAATALQDWTEARRAWHACGMQVPEGSGPPNFRFGMVPVRLDPNGDGEVVWADRIDPARARLLSIPLPRSPHNHGAIVLTDGAADGHRFIGDKEVPVFNVLDLITSSRLNKYIVELGTASVDAIDALVTCAEELGGAAEDWGSTTHILCAACSRGTPHEHPDTDGKPAHPHCGLAARDGEHAGAIIRTWLLRHPHADVVRWFDAASSGS
jgi:hypothetical protein